jgi:hypothetical protein
MVFTSRNVNFKTLRTIFYNWKNDTIDQGKVKYIQAREIYLDIVIH